MMLVCFFLATVFGLIAMLFYLVYLTDNRWSGNWYVYYVSVKTLYKYAAIVQMCVGFIWLFVKIPFWSFYISGALLLLALLLWIIPKLVLFAGCVRSFFRIRSWRQ